MSHGIDRRAFVKGTLLSAVAMRAGSVSAEEKKSEIKPIEVKGTLPKGKIGKLEISRMLLGGNLLTHFTHSRDLRYVYALAEHYNTDEKIMETLATAESYGVNTLVVHTAGHILDVLVEHRKRGGKMQWIICPTTPPDKNSAYVEQVRQVIELGADAIYVWGVQADRLVKEGKVDQIKYAVQVAKDHGVPSGVGAHDLEVIRSCEKSGVDAEFYIKTFHHHKYPTGPKPEQLKGPTSEVPGYWCKDPEGTIRTMKDVKKPWIAFKVMAAGAIPPKDAFEYAFRNGADFVLAGMFDFEIATDAAMINQILAGQTKRERAWFA